MINTLNWELQTTDIHALPVLGAGRPTSRCQQGSGAGWVSAGLQGRSLAPGESRCQQGSGGGSLAPGLLAALARPWFVDVSLQSPLLSSQDVLPGSVLPLLMRTPVTLD